MKWNGQKKDVRLLILLAKLKEIFQNSQHNQTTIQTEFAKIRPFFDKKIFKNNRNTRKNRTI